MRKYLVACTRMCFVEDYKLVICLRSNEYFVRIMYTNLIDRDSVRSLSFLILKYVILPTLYSWTTRLCLYISMKVCRDKGISFHKTLFDCSLCVLTYESHQLEFQSKSRPAEHVSFGRYYGPVLLPKSEDSPRIRPLLIFSQNL